MSGGREGSTSRSSAAGGDLGRGMMQGRVYKTPLKRAILATRRLAREVIAQDTLTGHPFAFANRRRDRIKIFYRDRDGYAIRRRRPEQGTFGWPAPDSDHLEWTGVELAAVLGGIDLKETRRRPRFTLQ